MSAFLAQAEDLLQTGALVVLLLWLIRHELIVQTFKRGITFGIHVVPVRAADRDAPPAAEPEP